MLCNLSQKGYLWDLIDVYPTRKENIKTFILIYNSSIIIPAIMKVT